MAARSNIEQGFYRDGKFHPVRKSKDYDAVRAKDSVASFSSRSRKRSNPIQGAAALSEAFHGRTVRSITEYVEELHEHSSLADLGRLLSVELEDRTLIKFGKKTRLASNEGGTQLFVVGGNQAVDLSQFDVDDTKESVLLGQIAHIDYSTAKQHLDEEDKTPGPYTHQLGEETGVMPFLIYDTMNERCSFVGGAYHIDIDMDGKFSAGIRD